MSLATVTRASLGVRALQRSGLEYSNFVTPAELNQLVDTSMAKIYNILVGLYQDYFVKVIDLDLSTSRTFQLPGDFFKIRHCFVAGPDGLVYEIPWLELAEIGRLTGRGGVTNIATGYNIIANMLHVYPEELQQSRVLRMYYIPEYTPPALDSDQIKYAVAFGWDEWVVNDVAAQISVKAKMPMEELVRERGIVEQRLRHEAAKRSAGPARRVADTGFSRNRRIW